MSEYKLDVVNVVETVKLEWLLENCSVAVIAVNVARSAFDNKIAQLSRPENLKDYVRDSMFQPDYSSYI